ncbi:MAG: MFS transporter [Sulfolobaceae archaeon]
MDEKKGSKEEIVITRGELVKVAFASVVGTTIEWYDFTVSATAAAIVWPFVFFPQQDPAAAFLFSIVTYSVGFPIRPIGAIIFGHFGDKYGRKSVLIFTLLTMGIGTLGIGLVPPYATIGIWGAILVGIFRILQGLSLGGEWGAVSTWITEFAAKSKYRAFWASWVQMGGPIGILSSNALFLYLTLSLTRSDFLNWGWRIPFYIGVIVVIVGAIIRYRLNESPLFKMIITKRFTARVPVVELFKNQWRTIVILAISWWYINTLIWTLTTFTQGYISRVNPSVPPYIGPLAGIMVSVGGIPGVLAGAFASDRIGRKIACLIGSSLAAVFSFPYILLISTGSLTLTFISQVIMAFIIHFGYAPLPAFFAEHFPTRYRASGTGFTYHIANPFSGAIAPIIAAYFTAIYGAINAAPYIGAIAFAYSITSVIATLFTRETMKKELE